MLFRFYSCPFQPAVVEEELTDVVGVEEETEAPPKLATLRPLIYEERQSVGLHGRRHLVVEAPTIAAERP